MANKSSGKFFFSAEKTLLPSIEESVAETAPSPPPLSPGDLLPQSADSTTEAATAKPKVTRTQFSIFQKVALENSFHASLYLTGAERDALAFKLGLSPTTVQTWFKNRRFKWRKEIKMADGAQPEPAIQAPPAFLYASPPPLTFWHTCVGPEHQQPEGSMCGCYGGGAPRMLCNNKTHW